MIRPEQIPDEVVEAFVDAYYTKDMTRKAAISAALNAWPDAEIYDSNYCGTFLKRPPRHRKNHEKVPPPVHTAARAPVGAPDV